MSTINNLQITLKKGDVKESTNSLNIHAFPIYIQAFSNINLENNGATADAITRLYPANIFVYQKNGTGLDPNQGDRFMKVATAIDIDSLPSYTVSLKKSDPNTSTEGDPITSIEGYPFFRYNEVKLFLDNPEELKDLWQFVQEDVKSLCLEYNTLQNLTTSTSISFPISTTREII